MHVIQQKILSLALSINLGELTLREIGERVGDPHPQKIKHHLDQLLKRGFLKKSGNSIKRVGDNSSDSFLSIPILGAANCGQALTFADEHIEGYLTVSPKMLRCQYKQNNFFAVRTIGNSMNNASVVGKSIEDGDYAIVDTTQRNLEDYNNKYVLSVISGMANIKRLIFDKANSRIMLLSESNQSYPPIYIHSDDFSDYMVNGVITDVIKSPESV